MTGESLISAAADGFDVGFLGLRSNRVRALVGEPASAGTGSQPAAALGFIDLVAELMDPQPLRGLSSCRRNAEPVGVLRDAGTELFRQSGF